MKFIKKYLFPICAVIILAVAFGIVEGVTYIVSPKYKEGKYVMTYRIYYPNSPRDYVIENNFPISVDSHRGTNIVYKVKPSKLMFVTSFRDISTFKTTAPIEVINYSYTEN